MLLATLEKCPSAAVAASHTPSTPVRAKDADVAMVVEEEAHPLEDRGVEALLDSGGATDLTVADLLEDPTIVLTTIITGHVVDDMALAALHLVKADLTLARRASILESSSTTSEVALALTSQALLRT